MKRKQRLPAIVPALVVVVSLLIFLFLTLVKPSIDENRTIRIFVDAVLRVMQQKNIRILKIAYAQTSLPILYTQQLCYSNLKGWKIKHVDSQPYPMETGSDRVAVDLELYYQLPASMLKPRGLYEEGNFPPYGKCTRYRTVCHLYFEKQLRKFILDGPKLDTRTNLLIPMPSREELSKSPFSGQ